MAGRTKLAGFFPVCTTHSSLPAGLGRPMACVRLLLVSVTSFVFGCGRSDAGLKQQAEVGLVILASSSLVTEFDVGQLESSAKTELSVDLVNRTRRADLKS